MEANSLNSWQKNKQYPELSSLSTCQLPYSESLDAYLHSCWLGHRKLCFHLVFIIFTGSIFHVAWRDLVSSLCSLSTGIPHVSVFGPVLFTYSTKPLVMMMRLYGWYYHCYFLTPSRYLIFILAFTPVRKTSIKKELIYPLALKLADTGSLNHHLCTVQLANTTKDAFQIAYLCTILILTVPKWYTILHQLIKTKYGILATPCQLQLNMHV